MNDPVRVLVVGTGQMGSGIAKLVLRKPGLELVGAHGRRGQRAGLDIGSAIGLDRELGIPIESDLAAAIEQARPDIAIHATCSTLVGARDEIELLVASGVQVISIAEEMAFPAASSTSTAERLDRLAVESGVTLLGTGINPGFVLDLLVVALTGVCARVEAITAPAT